MKIMYLTWGETPRAYGVYGSQVIRQFVANSLADSAPDYCFVAAVPVINSSLVREGRHYKDEQLKVEALLGNIPFYRIPIFTSQNFVFSSRFSFKTLHWAAHAQLASLVEATQPDIIHARSYHATFAAIETKRKYGFNYKVIFDARGLWPEEVAWKKGYARDGRNYSFLKDLERKLLEESDVCISVSETMEAELKAIQDFNSELIYLSADTSKLSFRRKSEKLDYSHNERKIKLCYVGAMAEHTWHSASQLGALYKHIASLGFDTALKIITTSDHQSLRRAFLFVPTDKLVVKSIRSVDELVNEFKDVNIGVLPYRTNSTYFETVIGKSILGTKTAEYISAKLPVLVNKNCEGAAHLVKRYQLGISYNPSTFSEIDKDSIHRILDINDDTFTSIANREFSYEENSKKYYSIYQKLLSSKSLHASL